MPQTADKRTVVIERAEAVEMLAAVDSGIDRKLRTTTQGGEKGVVGKYQKYQLRVTRKFKITGVTRNTW